MGSNADYGKLLYLFGRLFANLQQGDNKPDLTGSYCELFLLLYLYLHPEKWPFLPSSTQKKIPRYPIPENEISSWL